MIPSLVFYLQQLVNATQSKLKVYIFCTHETLSLIVIMMNPRCKTIGGHPPSLKRGRYTLMCYSEKSQVNVSVYKELSEEVCLWYKEGFVIKKTIMDCSKLLYTGNLSVNMIDRSVGNMC